jgi:hypothetical protein
MKNRKMSSSRSALNKVLRSAFAWLIVFAIICSGCALLIPGRSLSAADGVAGTFKVLVTKLAAFLPSSEQPDIVFLGSSLILVPAVRCDDRLSGKSACYDRWYYDRYIPGYTQSIYLENQLKDKTGLSLKIKNLGVASSIMSDQWGIFQLMLSEGKRPRLLVLGLAPRDFLDNTQQKHLETPTRVFMREYSQSSLLPESLSAGELLDSAGRIEHRFQKVFGSLKNGCTNLACQLTGHPSRSEFSNGPVYVGDRPNRLVDIETYRKLYNPPNFKMLAQQNSYLSRLLETARQNGISVLVVNMPLTRENTDTLASEALNAYTRALAHVTQEYGAGFLDIGSHSPEYTLADFEDCCHLNGRGGEKFYASLVSYITGNEQMLAALQAKKSKNPAICRSTAASISWQAKAGVN